MVIPYCSIYLNQIVGFSLAECGYIMACYGIGSFFGAFIGGVLTDKFGFFVVQAFSLFTTSLVFFMVMNFQSFPLLCIGFFCVSFFADLFRPANITAVETFSKKENLVRSISLIRLAINLGYAIGPFVGGIVAASLGYSMLFIINGSAIFLAGVLFYFLFRNKQRKVKISKASKTVGMPWNDRKYLFYIAAFTLSILIFLQLIYTIPLYFKTNLVFDEVTIGSFMALNGLLIFIVEMPIIYKLENKYNPLHMVSVGTLLMGLGFFFLAIVPLPYVAAFLFIVFITFGELISFPFSNMYALSFANDQNRGKYMGMYTMTFSFSNIITPIAGMKIAEVWNFNTLWVIGAIVCLISCVALLQTNKPKFD